MGSPGQQVAEFRERLAELSDDELAQLISRAMRTFNLGLLAEASAEMSERKRAKGK